jgi:hypothetical protein
VSILEHFCGQFGEVFIIFFGYFGKKFFSPKQWVNSISEGTSHSVPFGQLRVDFRQLVDSGCG